MLVEQVDAVGLEALERGLGNLPDVIRSAVQTPPFTGLRIDVKAELGCDNDTIAYRGQRFADESFYRDSRNVGLWAKKRAKEMGVDLGSQFEETVEKARSGKILDDL